MRKKKIKPAEPVEPELPRPVADIIPELCDSQQPLQSSKLVELSGIRASDMEVFKSYCSKAEDKRRRQIVNRLIELAEDSVELDFDTIFEYSLQDPDAEVRSQAIAGLWENEEPSLVSSFIHLLEQDSSEKVQSAAAVALGKFALMAECKTLRPIYKSRIQQALLGVFNQPEKSIEVRRRALESVAAISSLEVKTAIMEAYRAQDKQLRISSIYAMGRNCDSGWLPMLLQELSSPDTEMRYEAAQASGELEAIEAVPYLVKLIGDEDIDVRLASITALGKIGGNQAKKYLKNCLQVDNQAIRDAAKQALAEIEANESPLSLKLGDFKGG